jgi:serine/threonine-protein kinase
MRLAMEGAFESTAAQTAESTRSIARPARQQPATLLASAVALLALGALALSILQPSSQPVVRVRVTAEPVVTSGIYRDVAISPEGARVAYVNSLLGRSGSLQLRDLDQLEARELSSAMANARSPFFSPDGEWVGFFRTASLLKVSVLGGPPTLITNIDGTPRGASWDVDGTIVFATANPGSGLLRVSADGGEPEVVTTKDEGVLAAHWWPDVLPAGRGILYTIVERASLAESARVAVLDLETGVTRILVPNGSSPRYLPTGHLAYVVDGALMGVGFDLDRLETIGNPVPLTDDVSSTDSGAANFDVSDHGALLYLAGTRTGFNQRRTAVWVDRSGREEPLAVEPGAYFYPRVSPDGTRLLLDARDEEDDLWIWDIGRTTLSRFTFDPASDIAGEWTRDGDRVVFTSGRAGSYELFSKDAGGAGGLEQLTADPTTLPVATGLTSEDEDLVLSILNPQTGWDLARLRPMNGNTPEPLVTTDSIESNAERSPDGRWLVYQSDISGSVEVYVRPYPDVEAGLWQISSGGGISPFWGPDGSELFYRAVGQMMRVPVDAGSTFNSGTPEMLFADAYWRSSVGGRAYDITPDGERFVMLKSGDGDELSGSGELILVQNWFEELKARVPTGQ